MYGPNKRQDVFYENVVREANDLISKYNVTRVFMAGNLNIELTPTPGRYATSYENKARRILKLFMSKNGMQIISNTENHTWNRTNKRSTIWTI